MGRGVKTASAGPAGDGVRSDLCATFTGASAGGVKIDIASKVAPYYGDAIRAQATAVLAALGVTGGTLTLDDQGALPFVIAARIEAAVRRGGGGKGRRALADRVPLRPASAPDRRRRSRLYLPGSQPKLFVNAGLHGPDGIILDLEDSVHPDEKDAARLLVRNALLAVDFGTAERMVRINPMPRGRDDLEEIVPGSPDLILIPKVEGAADVTEAAAAIEALCAEHGITRPIHLMPILESALGIENAFAIATVSERVVALTLGLEDLTADLGVAKTKDGGETLYARQRVINAARAAGIQAIDSVFGDVGDRDGLAIWARRSRALGFSGMGCIHPGQIDIIHRAFAPASEEIARARRIVAAFKDAEAHGLGVVSLDSKMIDPPVVARAQELVAEAHALGLLRDDGAAS